MGNMPNLQPSIRPVQAIEVKITVIWNPESKETEVIAPEPNDPLRDMSVLMGGLCMIAEVYARSVDKTLKDVLEMMVDTVDTGPQIIT